LFIIALFSTELPFTPVGRCGSEASYLWIQITQVTQPQVPACGKGNSRWKQGISLDKGDLGVARPYWSGQVRISLVSFGVKLFPATEAKSEIRFHQIDRKSGERVRHQKVAEGDDVPVEKEDIVKGYEYSKGHYVQIDPKEIEHLRIPSKHTLEIQQFVPVDDLDRALFEKPYFVLPEKDTDAAAFAVVRRALQDTGTAGLGKIAMAGREHLMAISVPSDSKLPGLMDILCAMRGSCAAHRNISRM